MVGRAIVAFGAGAIAGFLAGADAAPGYAGSAGLDAGAGASSWAQVLLVMGMWGGVFAAISLLNSWALARGARRSTARSGQ